MCGIIPGLLNAFRTAFNVKRSRPLFLLGLLLLSGCNFPSATPSQPPTEIATTGPLLDLPSGEGCLIGQWELFDFSDSIESIIPTDTIVYKGTNGRMRWTFTAGGIVEAQADNFSISLAQADDPSAIVTILTNGTARRFYAAGAPGVISFSNPDDSEFTYSGIVNGVTVDLAPLLKAIAPVPPASGTIAYKCNGNSLIVTPPTTTAVPMELVRIPRP